MRYDFLSPEWFAAVQSIADQAPPPPEAMAGVPINMVVTGSPTGDLEAHLMDGVIQTGWAADAPTKITVSFKVAKQLFIEGDNEAAMQAFMSGRIKMEGDVSKMMAMTSASADPAYEAFSQKIQDLTQ